MPAVKYSTYYVNIDQSILNFHDNPRNGIDEEIEEEKEEVGIFTVKKVEMSLRPSVKTP